MKILHIISGANPKLGGPIQGIRNYEYALNQLESQRTLVCFETPEDIIAWQFPETLDVIGLGKATGKWQYNKALIPWLKINIFNYDTIIINGLWTYHVYATLIVIRCLKKMVDSTPLPKVFIMPHGMLDPWFQHSNSRRFKAIRNAIYWPLIENKNVNEVDGLLFTCEDELLLARQTFSNYFPKKELNVGYGIATPPECISELIKCFRTEFSIPNEVSFLLFISRIDPKKGVDLLLAAYRNVLLNAGSSIIPYLIIAGHGLETNYGKRLLWYIKKNPVLHDKVKFVGQLSGDLKWGAICACEAFVLPSHQENFGIAVAEALACSKPVLITDKVNIFQKIIEGGGGIVNSDTIVGTTASLQQWFSMSLPEKKQMGKNAKAIFLNYFSIGKAALSLLKALQNN